MKRPLPEQNIHYALEDLTKIEQLYDDMKSKDHITDTIATRSELYVSLWNDAKPAKTDKYRNHPLLPLNILIPNTYGNMRVCMHCKRRLPQDAYGKAAWRLAEKRQCWVCRAISVRGNMHSEWARHDDDEF